MEPSVSPAADEGLRRVVLAFRSEGFSGPAARLATQLAMRLDAELFGVLVEDARLVRAAALPLAMEIDRLTGIERPLDKLRIELSLKAMATHMREQLRAVVAGQPLNWSFETMRGILEDAALVHARASDYVVLGSVSGHRVPPFRAAAGDRGMILHPAGEPDQRLESLAVDLAVDLDRGSVARTWRRIAWTTHEEVMETVRGYRPALLLAPAALLSGAGLGALMRDTERTLVLVK
jgi:hypothetical protein